MPETDWLIPAAIVLGGYVVMGITGFGSALVLVPLLAPRWPLPEVVALAILLDLPTCVVHGVINRREVRWAELARLVPGMAVGTLAGLWLLGALDRTWPLFLLGVWVVFVGVRALLPLASPAPARPGWSHVAGLLVGLIEVMFATAGPIVVAWFQRRMSEAAGLRASVPVVMLLAGSIAIAVLWSSGQVNPSTVLPRWLAALPVAVAGVVIGNRLAARISPVLMKRLLAALLAISGLSLMRHALG